MATTIETRNVVTRFVTEYDQRSGQTAARQADRITSKIDGGFGKVGREAKQSFDKIERDSRKSLTGVEKNFKNTENRVTTLFRGLGTKLAAIGIGATLGAGINKAINEAGDFESLSKSFAILTGNLEVANALVEQLNEFSLATPFRPDEINNSARTLLGFGRNAREVTQDLEFIGNAAAATGADLQGLAVVYGQVAGAGRLQGQDALQFINQGLPIYKLLEESLGKSTTELKELQSQGKITFEDLRDALKGASEEGGAFFNALEEQSKTFNGLKSTFKGFISEALRGIGNIFLPAAKSTLTALISLTKGFVDFIRDNTEGIRDFLGQITTTFTNIFKPLINSFSNFFTTLFGGVNILEAFQSVLTTIAQRLQVFVNLIALGVDAVTGLVNAFIDLVPQSTRIRTFFSEFNAFFRNLPALVNGGIEVLSLYFENSILRFQNTINRLKLAYEQTKNFFGADNDLEITIRKGAISQNQARIDAADYVAAFREGFEEINDIKIEFDDTLDAGKKKGTDEGQALIDSMTSTIKEGSKEVEQEIKKIGQIANVGSIGEIGVSAVSNDTNTGALLRERARAEREIIREQIVLNDLLASNVLRTEEAKAQAVARSTETQLQLRLKILEINRKLLSDNGGSVDELRQIDLAISGLNLQLSELANQSENLSTFDSLLTSLFPEGDLDGIKQGLQNLYGELLNYTEEYARNKEAILDGEVDRANQRIDDILNLSSKASQEQLDFERTRLEQAQKNRDKFTRQTQAAAKLEAAANIVAALSRIAAETGIASFGSLPLFLTFFAGLASAAANIFHEGTESVGNKGNRAPSQSFLKNNEVFAILQKRERVMTVKQNKLLAGMSNDDVVSYALAGKQYASAKVAPNVMSIVSGDSSKNKEIVKMRKSIESMEKTIKNLRIESKQTMDESGLTNALAINMAKKQKQIGRIR